MLFECEWLVYATVEFDVWYWLAVLFDVKMVVVEWLVE